MAKFWVIFKREYTQVVKKKSFLVGIFLTPALMAAFILLPGLLATTEQSEPERVAIVDRSGMQLGERFAEEVKRYTITEDEIEAYRIVEIFELRTTEGERYTELIDSLSQVIQDKGVKYVLAFRPNPQLSDTNLTLITNSDDFRAINRFERTLTDIVSSIRLQESDVNLPVDSVLTLTNRIDLQIRDTKGESIPFEVKYFSALAFVMLIYAMIVSYGSILMRSVIEEKSSRIMEVLLSSVTPFELMLGKVLGLGAAALTTVVVWVVLGGLIMVGTGGTVVAISDSISRVVFNPVIVTFFVLFLVSGYLLYSTIFALIGSILNSEKESQNYIFPIVIFLMLPVIVGIGVVRDPYVIWAQVMSYIPLFSPTMMIMRIMFIAPTETSYSLFSGIVFEGTVSFLLVVAATLLMTWISGRIFRIGILMYGKRPTLPELMRWVRHK
ncbi:ABC transporter permease subunit [candidate division GN15 bacterium]|nr:ABC transporter permease subunit [candidate division GN15 bacterium]